MVTSNDDLKLWFSAFCIGFQWGLFCIFHIQPFDVRCQKDWFILQKLPPLIWIKFITRDVSIYNSKAELSHSQTPRRYMASATYGRANMFRVLGHRQNWMWGLERCCAQSCTCHNSCSLLYYEFRLAETAKLCDVRLTFMSTVLRRLFIYSVTLHVLEDQGIPSL